MWVRRCSAGITRGSLTKVSSAVSVATIRSLSCGEIFSAGVPARNAGARCTDAEASDRNGFWKRRKSSALSRLEAGLRRQLARGDVERVRATGDRRLQRVRVVGERAEGRVQVAEEHALDLGDRRGLGRRLREGREEVLELRVAGATRLRARRLEDAHERVEVGAARR